MTIKSKFIVPVCIILLSLTACTPCNTNTMPDSASSPALSEISQGYPYTFTDSTGASVTLQEQPRKVAILFSSYADIWQTAGGEVSVTVQESVDRGFASDTCLLVDTKSGHTSIDLEQLVASQPDLVIGTADYDIQRETIALCRANRIPGALFRIETFEDYLSMLKICTDLTGQPERYDTCGVQIGKQIDSLLEQVRSHTQIASDNSLRILFVRAGSAARSTKAKTPEDNFVCKMLQELCTYNIAQNAPILLDGLSLEEILREDPDHIFITTMGDEAAAREYMDSVLAKTGWRSLTAVQQGAVSYLPKELFHYKPNAGWYEAYYYLTHILYPEISFDEP